MLSFRVLKPLPEAQPVLHAPPPKPHSNPHLRLLLPAKASWIRAREAAEQSAACWPQGIPGPEPGDSELPKTDRGGPCGQPLRSIMGLRVSVLPAASSSYEVK